MLLLMGANMGFAGGSGAVAGPVGRFKGFIARNVGRGGMR